jgi:hypothetical protein
MIPSFGLPVYNLSVSQLPFGLSLLPPLWFCIAWFMPTMFEAPDETSAFMTISPLTSCFHIGNLFTKMCGIDESPGSNLLWENDLFPHLFNKLNKIGLKWKRPAGCKKGFGARLNNFTAI